MKSTIAIRQTTLDDAHGYRECLGAVASEGKYLGSLEAPPLESMQAWVQKLLDAGFPHLIALDGTRIIGWLDISPDSRVMYRHLGRLGMGVLPEYRGQGIGSRLMERALSEVWHKGIDRVELEVYSSNSAAMHLYKKFGFKVEGTRRKAKKFEGIHEDVIVMGLLKEEAI